VAMRRPWAPLPVGLVSMITSFKRSARDIACLLLPVTLHDCEIDAPPVLYMSCTYLLQHADSPDAARCQVDPDGSVSFERMLPIIASLAWSLALPSPLAWR